MSKNLIAKGTKAFHVSVLAATMLWSSGVASALPAAAETVTLKDGDLVKSTTAPDVYWYAGGKRSPFPNAAVFNSWNLSFKNVVKMSQADLNKIDLSGSNVTYRPGTRMIKIMTDPRVYAVSPSGTLHWVASEAVAKAIAGDAWNKNIDDVADVFFTNYTKSADLTDANMAIAGSFLRDAVSGNTYYINEDGTKSLVDAAGLAANNVNSKYIWTASGTQLSGAAASTLKPTISAADASLMVFQPKSTTSTTPTTPTSPTTSTGTGLTVSLASDSPATTSILVGTGTVGAQALVDMLKLKLVASNDGDIKVSTLKFKRTGVASDSDINAAYLYANGIRLAEMQSVSGGILTFVGAPLFTVSKGASLDLSVKIDLATSATSGKTLGLSLNAATDVSSGTGVTVSGTYPLNGSLMSVASVGDLGRLTIANVSPGGAIAADAQLNYEAWRFTLAASSQDILVSRLAMTNTGTTSATDLANFKLYDGGTQIGSTVAAMDANKVVTFDLSAAPYKITSGQTKTLSMKLDIVGGASRTFQWSFQKASDIQSKDNNYNVALFPFPTGGTAGVWTIVRSNSATTATTINSGSISVSKTSDSPSGNVADDGTSVTLGKFDFKATGEDVKVSSLALTATVTGGATIKQVRVYAAGTQVGATTASLAGDGATLASYTLGNSLVVKAGTSTLVTVVADLTGTAVATNTVKVTLKLGVANGQGALSLSTVAVPGADTDSNTLTIAAGSLSASLVSGLQNMTVVKGATLQRVGAVTLTAGAAEGVDVTSITLTDSAGTAIEALGTALTNVKLFNGTTQLGATYVNPGTSAGSSMSFSISPALSLAASGQAQIDIKADILSSANISGDTGIIQVSAASGTGKSTSTTISLSAAQNIQTFSIVAGGTLTISVDPTTKQDQQVVMMSTGNTLGAWKFHASNAEDLTLNQLIFVDNSANNSSSQNVQNMKLYVAGLPVGNAVNGLSYVQNSTVYADANSTATNIRMTDANMSAAHVGKYIVITDATSADLGKVGLITAVAVNAGAWDDYTILPVGAAWTSGAAVNGKTYKIVSGAVFSGIGAKVAANNDTVVTLKGDINDSVNASVGAASHFVLATIATMTGAGTDTVVAQGASSGAYATITANTAYAANNVYPYRTKLTVKANSASPSGVGKTRRGNDTFFMADFANDPAYEARLRAAGLYQSMDADQANWTSNGAADTGFTSATSAAAAGITGTAATAVRFTEGSGTTVAAFAAHAGTNAGSYNYVSFWIKSSVAKEAAGDLGFFLNDAASLASVTAQYNVPALVAGKWTHVLIDLSGVAHNATDDFYGINVLANADNNGTIDLDEVKFHNDFVKLDLALSGGANVANAIPFTMATASNSVTGYVHNNGAAATSYSVYFVPTTSDFVVSPGTTSVLNFSTDTSSLLGAASSLSPSISLGSSASTNTTPGGIVWYDGATSTSVYWVDQQPIQQSLPVGQSNSLSYN